MCNSGNSAHCPSLPISQFPPGYLISSVDFVLQDLMCVLVCISRLFFQYVEKLHTLHLLGFSSLCELKCFLNESTREDSKSH